ncbi:MAG: hypothetical protein WCA85_11115 [Paraburkholderia sp.]|jgi:hypothetical protein|uniref:hypothetical protein n=1 Tax=Paraburkholderia sp. TaxID=1926495 RepID=UPI003C38FC66
MLSRLVRILLALTAIAPLSISLAYLFARDKKYVWAALAFSCCLLLGAAARWIIARASSTLETLPVVILKARSADKEVIGFFVAYALPLVLRGQSAPDFGGWLFAGGMLLFVLWGTHTLQVNPVLGVMGFHFYEVDTKGGITYLMITRRKISNILSVENVVQLSEYGILEAHKK